MLHQILLVLFIATALLRLFLPDGSLSVGVVSHRFEFLILRVFAGVQQLLQCQKLLLLLTQLSDLLVERFVYLGLSVEAVFKFMFGGFGER